MEMGIIKGNQSQMKNTLSEMKSMLNGINGVNKEEDWTTDIEDGEAKDTQSECKKKRIQDYNNNLRRLWDTIKCKNIWVIGILEGKQDIEEIFEGIMMENFHNLVKKIDIQPQEAQSLKKEEPKEAHTKTHHN